MAQPIPLLLSSRTGVGANGHVEAAAQTHAEALLSALELLQLLHDRGVLELLRGAVGAGDRLIGTLTEAVDTPETLRAIRNFILLTKFFASIPPDILNSLVQTAMQGAQREKTRRAPGVF